MLDKKAMEAARAQTSKKLAPMKKALINLVKERQQMDKFVVGFAFTKSKSLVLLATKNRPKWQEGLLNGIGGKIEKGETPIQAMGREAMEEAGIDVCWEYKGVMKGINNDGNDFECHIFYAYDDAVTDFVQVEDEPLKLYLPEDVPRMPIVSNLAFLIPYGMCGDDSSFMKLEY